VWRRKRSSKVVPRSARCRRWRSPLGIFEILSSRRYTHKSAHNSITELQQRHAPRRRAFSEADLDLCQADRNQIGKCDAASARGEYLLQVYRTIFPLNVSPCDHFNVTSSDIISLQTIFTIFDKITLSLIKLKLLHIFPRELLAP